jgi:antitoxin ParD1/3/4
MAWAKPLVDEARAAIARRETITLEEHRTRNAERLAAQRK